ncbi:uncharacterized protein BKCO1_19000238 [Diplodia corticola]|uniref:Uncharacterized protein n=1 Tax=Diplodia corticola TaxID=236234 RepID=A0A1J9S5Z7_9PEZI|nr:uncharacterized protein BKCO1_19000238 [Diplodia corticola]OJD35037.1 hypothetical protein BKCO1_19000238 [Diplodia corticola]
MSSPSGYQLAKELLGLVPKPTNKPAATAATTTTTSNKDSNTKKAGIHKPGTRPSPAKRAGVTKREQQQQQQQQKKNKKKKRQEQKQKQKHQHQHQNQNQNQQPARHGQSTGVKDVVPAYRDECIRYRWDWTEESFYEHRLASLTLWDQKRWGGLC